jgi:hypothetical protein
MIHNIPGTCTGGFIVENGTATVNKANQYTSEAKISLLEKPAQAAELPQKLFFHVI